MIENLKPYPAYKESDIPWLGKVPENWKVQRLKSIAHIRYGLGQPPREAPSGLPLIRATNVDHGRIVEKNLIRVDALDVPHTRSAFLSEGEIIVVRSGAYTADSAIIPKKYSGAIAGYDMVVTVLRAQPRYIAWALLSTYVREDQLITASMRSAQPHLNADELGAALFLMASDQEQSAIVRFLDYADRRIRRYIQAKRKLIALLREQKQAIVLRAVTRGLDPSVHLKPSGVKWLGDVPEHWGVSQIGHFGRVGNGSTPSRGNPVYWDGGTYPWLNSSCVNQHIVSKSDQVVTDRALRECHLPRVQPGSVLVAITGQGKTRGTAAVLTIEATINQHIAYITPCRDVVTTEYLHLALVAAYRELRAISDDSGGTKGALTCGDISHFKVALPPLDEQVRIVSSVRRDTAGSDAAIIRAEREIGLLEEYRTRLISDVVTGQLDVRSAATYLPEEADDLALLDDPDMTNEESDAEEAAPED